MRNEGLFLLLPWLMAGINTRVVRRSNALQGWAYGRRFRYREVTGFGASPAAPALAVTASAGTATPVRQNDPSYTLVAQWNITLGGELAGGARGVERERPERAGG